VGKRRRRRRRGRVRVRWRRWFRGWESAVDWIGDDHALAIQ